MACVSNINKKIDLSYFLKATKFNEEEIRNIFKYFSQFANDENYVKFNEFKRSLGVLGAKSHEFICQRIFNLIDVNKKSEISFDNYITFFNLVNFGSNEQKLEYSFNFFDLKQKGEIDLDSFSKVVLSICELLSLVSGTPSKIRNKEDIEMIFEEIVKKYSRRTLNLKSFIHFSNVYPEMLDFFDIFNNNLLKSKILKISLTQIEDLDSIHKKLINIIQTCNVYTKRSKQITLCHKKMIISDKLLNNTNTNRNESILLTDKEIFETKNFKSTYETKPWKDFKVSNKIELETIKDNNADSSLEWEEEDNDNWPTLSKDDINLECLSFEKKVDLNPTLEIISPFIPPAAEGNNYKNYYRELESEGLNLNNCLIIKDRFQFISYIEELTDRILSIIKDIDPTKQKVFRRTGIKIDLENVEELDKEEYLNVPFNIPDSKGLILFGNKNVEFLLNTMTGIKYAVNSLGGVDEMFDLPNNVEAFKEINTFSFTQNIFEKENKILFIDYAPKIFHNLRKMFKISSQDYLRSLGHENFLGNLILVKNRSLKELCSTGKSGSFFYFSYDSKFLVKTIPEHEFLVFYAILKDYYSHMYNNRDTLLQRYFGMHLLEFNDTKYYFVLMNNVFDTKVKVEYKYDLKGSRYKRLSRDPNKSHYNDYDYSIPMKDLDFTDRNEKLDLNHNDAELLYKQVQNDALFLSSKNINDYSFLIGIHEIKTKKNQKNGSTLISEMLHFYNREEINLGDKIEIGHSRKPFYKQCRNGLLSKDRSKIYFFGIIDIFTNYSAKKTMEHWYKSVFQGNEISCKPPNEYYERFCAFLMTILLE